MEKENLNKIIIVSLCDKMSVEIGKTLSQNLGMMFCDVDDLVQYELIDKDMLADLTSKQYLEQSEAKVMRHVASFENVVVAINYDYFTKNLKTLKKGAISIFVEFSKKFVNENGTTINALTFENRTKNLQTDADFCVKVVKTDANFVCEKIINTLRSNL